MFTGIVQAVGRIAGWERRGEDARLRVAAEALSWAGTAVGDSIAVQGVCLTAVAVHADGFDADVSAESLARTTLGGLAAGDRVNLERALTPSTPLGGHLVSGHVDGVGELVERRPEGRSIRLVIDAPRELARYIATKGSVAVDGVSLTVNEVEGRRFGVNIVPHTAQATTLGACRTGQTLNIEVDVIARYLERLLLGERGPGTEAGVTRELLARAGFIDEGR